MSKATFTIVIAALIGIIVVSLGYIVSTSNGSPTQQEITDCLKDRSKSILECPA